MVPRKRGATATNTKMMPRQHIGYQVVHGDTGAKGKVTGACKRWWDDPGFRVSHGLVAWKTSDNTDTVQTKGASHPTCIHAFTGVVSVVIPSKEAFSSDTSS